MFVTLVAEWILAGGTVGLLIATAVLAWATWNLYKATRQLALIEADRERRNRLVQRRAKLETKILLASKIVSMDPGAIASIRVYLRDGILTTHLQWFADLAPLLEHGHDQVPMEVMDRILQAIDQLRKGSKYVDPPAAGIMQDIELARDRLGYDITNWRRDLTSIELELGTRDS